MVKAKPTKKKEKKETQPKSEITPKTVLNQAAHALHTPLDKGTQ